jgi:acetyl-CoA C-acetyltransferase
VVQLGALVIKEALKRAGLRPESSAALKEMGPEALKGEKISDLEKKYGEWDQSMQSVQVDEVIMGNVLQGGQGQNTARQATIYAGLPKETNACTVNKVCASGLKAITIGARTIGGGQGMAMIVEG